MYSALRLLTSAFVSFSLSLSLSLALSFTLSLCGSGSGSGSAPGPGVRGLGEVIALRRADRFMIATAWFGDRVTLRLFVVGWIRAVSLDRAVEDVGGGGGGGGSVY